MILGSAHFQALVPDLALQLEDRSDEVVELVLPLGRERSRRRIELTLVRDVRKAKVLCPRPNIPEKSSKRSSIIDGLRGRSRQRFCDEKNCYLIDKVVVNRVTKGVIHN